jgi:hypothetical protein
MPQVNIVVNHLHFSEPVTEAVVVSFREGVAAVVAAGGRSARVARVDDTHVILLLEFDSVDDADRISREVGGPWMREHVVPLLSAPPERVVCEVLAEDSSPR